MKMLYITERKEGDTLEKAQCEQLADQYPGTLILQLRGKFYNAFDDSAKVLASIMGYKVKESTTGRAKCGFPSDALNKVMGCLKTSRISYVILENGVPADAWEGGEKDNFTKEAEKIETISQENEPNPMPIGSEQKEIPSCPHTETIYLQGSGADLRNAMISLKGEIDRLTGLGIAVRSMTSEHEMIPGRGCMIYALAICGGKE